VNVGACEVGCLLVRETQLLQTVPHVHVGHLAAPDVAVNHELVEPLAVKRVEKVLVGSIREPLEEFVRFPV